MSTVKIPQVLRDEIENEIAASFAADLVELARVRFTAAATPCPNCARAMESLDNGFSAEGVEYCIKRCDNCHRCLLFEAEPTPWEKHRFNSSSTVERCTCPYFNRTLRTTKPLTCMACGKAA